MSKSLPTDSIAALIYDFPKLPHPCLRELWQEAFGRPAGKIRPALMLPILAFRIQEKAYGGLSPKSTDR